jgi:hypothetical protein
MDEADSNPGSSAVVEENAGQFNALAALERHWRQSVRYFGLARTLREFGGALWRAALELLPSHRQARFGDLDYDWENSVNTTRSNVGFLTQLQAGLLGGAYYASDPWIFEQIMQALPIDFARFTFIDLGAGKGRALLMASDCPFKKIIGVEFMPDLCRAALENITNYSSERRQCAQIEMACMDACDFEFPDGPLVVYLFNPFSEPIFVKVMENLRQSLMRAAREVFVTYRYTEHERLLAEAGWLEKVEGTEQWTVYRNRQKI